MILTAERSQAIYLDAGTTVSPVTFVQAMDLVRKFSGVGALVNLRTK